MTVAKPEHADFEWAVKLNRIGLQAIGLWPTDDRNVKRKFLGRLRTYMNIILIVLVATIPMIWSMIKDCGNLKLLVDQIAFAVPTTISSLKFVLVAKKRKVLLSMLDMVEDDWASSKTDVERDVMIRRAQLARTVTVWCYVSVLLSGVFLVALPTFGLPNRYVPNGTNVKKLLPLPGVYFAVDVTVSPYFEIFFVLQSITLTVILIGYTGVDNFFGILILHICGQLENLRMRLATIKQLENFDQTLEGIVEKHIRLIRAVDAIENTFTILLLAVLLNFGIFTCCYSLAVISIIEGENFSAFRLFHQFCVLMNTFLQTALYCIAGQFLVNESEGVSEAAYEFEWTKLQPSKARNLMLIMARAQRPLYVTAGKIFPMTIATYCNILKASASYMSFLITVL